METNSYFPRITLSLLFLEGQFTPEILSEMKPLQGLDVALPAVAKHSEYKITSSTSPSPTPHSPTAQVLQHLYFSLAETLGHVLVNGDTEH